jgi:PAS domain S-box-containing protein
MEWSGITKALDTTEDLVGALVPMWWAFVFYAFAQEMTSHDLRQSEEKYRLLLKNLPGIVYKGYKDWSAEFVNEKIQSLTGYSMSEFGSRRMKWSDLIPEEDLEIAEEGFIEGLKTDKSFVREYRIKTNPGDILWIQDRGQIICDDEGEIEYVSGVFFDITERKRAEEMLQAREEYYRAIVEDSTEFIVRWTPDGTRTFANRAYCSYLGLTREEVIGSNIFPSVIAEDRERLKQKIAFLTPEKAIAFSEERKILPDGRMVWQQWSERGIFDGQGRLVEIQSVGRDITDLKLAEEEKTELEARLQRAQRMEAIGTLAGGVAHDLNNILSGLVSYPELLLVDISEDSPLRKPLLTIQKSGKRAAAIVQDLLTLARRGVAVTAVVNLNHIIAEHLESPECDKLKAFHPDLEFDVNLDDDLLNIKGSPIHLSETVMNLVANAAEAMPDGGKISVSTENQYIDRPIRGYEDVREGDYAVLSVSDTGLGISSEDLGRIFEPFYTKKVMGRSGTGLGMSVVWGTVKDHQGYINMQSTPGEGTKCTLYFPITREEPVEEKGAVPLEEYMGNEQILVVDDVENQRQIAHQILTRLGYSVTTVAGGEEAVEYLKNNSPDLLVLDMIMDPGIDGLETYRRILEIHPGQKAIIASGFSETERVKEAKRLGAGAYVRKPYVLEKIGLAVRTELDK